MDYRRLRIALTLSVIAGASLLSSLFSTDARAALPAFTTPQQGYMRAHFINVGQGSSVLLEFSCAAALIDTGGEKDDQFDSVQALQSYLDQFFARRSDLKKTLSLVLITHAHIDHTRGLPMVLSRYVVPNYVDNGAETGSGGRQQMGAHAKADAKGSGITRQAVTEPEVDVRDGLTSKVISPISCDKDIKFHAMWGALQSSGGWTKTVLNDQNNSSVVTRLDFGKTVFLFMGDLEADVHDAMLGFFCDKLATPCSALRADVYHVAHHGSYNGTSPDLVEAVTPKIAVISMGPPDRDAMWTAVAYGHPRKVAVDMLSAPGTGVSLTRTPAIDVKLATKAGSNGAAAKGEFVSESMSKAIYATGWDGTVVVTADKNQKLQVDVEGHP
jgi:competence protein ComEC